MRDLELLKLAKTTYSNMPTARAAEAIAHEYDLSPDSVRGRLSRSDTPENRAQLIQHMIEDEYKTDTSTVRQRSVLRRASVAFDIAMDKNEGSSFKTCVFMSDIHFPFVRHDALGLAYTIIDDIKPDVVSAGNDLLDNAGYGRWDDTRTLRGKMWSSDVSRVRDLERVHYETIDSISGGAAQPHLMGNHDAWYYNFLRKFVPQDSERIIADYMEFLEDCGVQQFSDGSHENYIRLSPNLVWWHGQFASKNPSGNAQNTLAQFTIDGQASTVVVGHTHRPIHVPGYTMGRNGVDFYNNGCLCRMEDVPYLKRDPRGWGLGITISVVDTESRFNNTALVVFYEDGNRLRADYNGKTYTVPLVKTTSGW